MTRVRLFTLIALSSLFLAVPCQSQIPSRPTTSQPPLGSKTPPPPKLSAPASVIPHSTVTSPPPEPVYTPPEALYTPSSIHYTLPPPQATENTFGEAPLVGTMDEDPYYGEGPAAGPTALPTNYYYDRYQKVRDNVTAVDIIGIIIGLVVLSLLLVGCVCIFRARRRNIQRARYGNTGAGVGSVEIF